jgi:hypothetical protein
MEKGFDSQNKSTGEVKQLLESISEHEQANKILQKAVIDRSTLLQKVYYDIGKIMGENITIVSPTLFTFRKHCLISTRNLIHQVRSC